MWQGLGGEHRKGLVKSGRPQFKGCKELNPASPAILKGNPPLLTFKDFKPGQLVCSLGRDPKERTHGYVRSRLLTHRNWKVIKYIRN